MTGWRTVVAAVAFATIAAAVAGCGSATNSGRDGVAKARDAVFKAVCTAAERRDLVLYRLPPADSTFDRDVVGTDEVAIITGEDCSKVQIDGRLLQREEAGSRGKQVPPWFAVSLPGQSVSGWLHVPDLQPDAILDSLPVVAVKQERYGNPKLSFSTQVTAREGDRCVEGLQPAWSAFVRNTGDGPTEALIKLDVVRKPQRYQLFSPTPKTATDPPANLPLGADVSLEEIRSRVQQALQDTQADTFWSQGLWSRSDSQLSEEELMILHHRYPDIALWLFSSDDVEHRTITLVRGLEPQGYAVIPDVKTGDLVFLEKLGDVDYAAGDYTTGVVEPPPSNLKCVPNR